MINSKLIGKWWVYKYNNRYALFRGDTCCDKLCRLPDDAITRWIYPEHQGHLSNFWYNPSSEILDISNIIFPPSEYLENRTITEIEIKQNGDYIIFDSISI